MRRISTFAVSLLILVCKVPANSQQVVANKWMETPTPVTANSADPAAQFRPARDRFYDNSVIGSKVPLTVTDAPNALMGVVSRASDPEIAEGPNRVILTATFTKFRSILSASERSIYTEVALKIDEIFQDRSGQALTSGQEVTLSLPGGTVLTPSGQKITYLVQPRELFLQPNRKYLLVLFYKPSLNLYLAADNWDISDGVVRPNTPKSRDIAKEGRSIVSGLTTSEMDGVLIKRFSENN